MSTPQGRAPRAATNTHRRGSRRGERSRSSSSDDPDPDAEPRACEWCGASIEHRRAGARHCSAAHRARAWRAAQRVEPFEPLASVPRPCDACPHLATLPDEDGDPICVVCGTLVGAPSSPNGHEAIFAHMVTDGEGQRRRVARRRRLGPGRWGGLVTRLPSDAAMRPRPVHYKRAAPVVADAAERGT